MVSCCGTWVKARDVSRDLNQTRANMNQDDKEGYLRDEKGKKEARQRKQGTASLTGLGGQRGV